MIDLQNAEHVLANIDAEHSARIAKAARAGCCLEELVESADAEAAVSRARRNVNSVRMALDEVSQDQIRANANLEAAKTAFDQLALAVLVEEFDTYLEYWARKRDEFRIAESELLGLLVALGERGREMEAKTAGSGIPWLQRLEKLQQPWHHLEHGHVELGQKEVNVAAARWPAVLHRLKADPNASF